MTYTAEIAELAENMYSRRARQALR